MSNLVLSAPTPADCPDIEAFEFTNRAFFEARINARPVSFYEPGGIMAAIESAQRDAADDRAYQFLVRDESGALVSRVNLTRVRREHFHSAEIGFRVAENHAGKGYGTQAVKLAVERAFGELKLCRIEATARLDNIASVRVLRRNGFTQFGHSVKSFHLGGKWHDLLYFECRAP